MLVFPAVQHFNTKCWGWQGHSIKPGKKIRSAFGTDNFVVSDQLQTELSLLIELDFNLMLPSPHIFMALKASGSCNCVILLLPSIISLKF